MQKKIKKIDLIKMDIEGAEYEILYNLPDKYFRLIKKIYMECHNLISLKNTPSEMVNFLKEKGYDVILKPTHMNEHSYISAERN